MDDDCTSPVLPAEIINCNKINAARMEAWLIWANEVICDLEVSNENTIREVVCEWASDPLDCNLLTP